MITRRQRPDLVVGPRVRDQTGMLELEEQVLESPPSPSAVPHRSPSMGARNLEWVPGLTTSDARHDMSVAVPPYITDTDAVVVCCTRARQSVRTVASFKYHRTPLPRDLHVLSVPCRWPKRQSKAVHVCSRVLPGNSGGGAALSALNFTHVLCAPISKRFVRPDGHIVPRHRTHVHSTFSSRGRLRCPMAMPLLTSFVPRV